MRKSHLHLKPQSSNTKPFPTTQPARIARASSACYRGGDPLPSNFNSDEAARPSIASSPHSLQTTAAARSATAALVTGATATAEAASAPAFREAVTFEAASAIAAATKEAALSRLAKAAFGEKGRELSIVRFQGCYLPSNCENLPIMQTGEYNSSRPPPANNSQEVLNA